MRKDITNKRSEKINDAIKMITNIIDTSKTKVNNINNEINAHKKQIQK